VDCLDTGMAFLHILLQHVLPPDRAPTARYSGGQTRRSRHGGKFRWREALGQRSIQRAVQLGAYGKGVNFDVCGSVQDDWSPMIQGGRVKLLTLTWLLGVLALQHTSTLGQGEPAPKHEHAGSQAPDTGGTNATRLAIVAGTVAGGVTAIHLYQQQAWWRTARAPFHFQEDLVYACNVDKVGHLYAANVLTFVFSKSLEWSNLKESDALLWGAIGSTLFQTYVEVEDGFSAYWGFDRVDFASDVVGAWYPVVQHYVPVLENFNFRFSYLPKNPGAPGAIPGQTHTIFDDYEGQTLWLTLTMKNLLPKSAAACWPDFLCLSVGMAVRDNLTPDRYLVWYLSPELDMTRIIPQSSDFLRTLGRALNFIHFPMPAVRFAPGVVWYGLYF